MKFNDRLRELRKGKGLTQDEFSKQSGLTRSAISMYERGEREPNFETLEKLADFFNVDMNYLLGKSDKTTYIPKGAFAPKWKRVPMMGYAAAGSPLEDLNQDTPFINVEGKYDVDFCITIRGDSMEDLGINDGDIVFVKSTPTIENGKVSFRDYSINTGFFDIFTVKFPLFSPHLPPHIITSCIKTGILGNEKLPWARNPRQFPRR